MTATLLALDTSATVPLLHRGHDSHAATHDAVAGWELALTGHSLAETYSVLTRLPGHQRLAPADAARLIRSRFLTVLTLPPETAARVHLICSEAGIHGGAVYDGLVGLAARAHGAVLGTRDARAVGTYEALGVEVRILS
ncbi:MAG: PIN domain-containing protein [Propionibacteriaceae bacterium]|jgi:predicted nucleic acid-binding protein|nr:PIN domain-containing protein [Propionibacteriaceae bacterium]